jgi:CDGSH iron-sulfur domain-containing protein 3
LLQKRVAQNFTDLEITARIATAAPGNREEIAMARLVEHERNTPYEIAEGTELPAYICACGLSKNKPFCDGSHKRTRDEESAALYCYDDSARVKVEKKY